MKWRNRAFSCYVIATMLEGKNNTFSLWEIRSIFMQNCFIVSALQHGCHENPLYYTVCHRFNFTSESDLYHVQSSQDTIFFDYHLAYKQILQLLKKTEIAILAYLWTYFLICTHYWQCCFSLSLTGFCPNYA